MNTEKQQTAYVSFCGKANGMLALWIDHRPSCNAEQRDPDGWTTDVDQATDYVIERLCEVSRCPRAKVVRLKKHAAEWWENIDRKRKLAAKKEARERLKDAQSLFPIDPEIEREGREVGTRRVWHKQSKKRAS